MRVKLDNKGHYLVSDPYCYWVAKEVTAEKTGKPYDRTVSGYYAKPLDAIESFIDRKVRASEAEDIVQLMKEVEDLKKMVKSWKPKVEGTRSKKDE
jgi:hypothetical protein